MLLKFGLAVLVAVSAYTTSGADDVKCVPMKWTGVAVGKIGAAEPNKDPYVVTLRAMMYVDYEKKILSQTRISRHSHPIASRKHGLPLIFCSVNAEAIELDQ